MPSITFSPSGARIEVPAGTSLLEACRSAGYGIPAPCGGKGLCGKCRVRILEGDVPADERQRHCLSGRLLDAGWRAACAAECTGSLVIADPRQEDAGGIILTDFMTREPAGGAGLWQKDAVMEPPSTDDQRDDASRLREALDGPDIGLPEAYSDCRLMARLPGVLREGGFACRVIGAGHRVLDFRTPGNASERLLGLAVDIGTTTLAAALCDLEDGSVLAVASAPNPQAAHGDDVISRIGYASRGAAELKEMQRLAAAAAEELSETARQEAGETGHPLIMTVSANTVMNHLLAGVPPAALAEAPFIPAFLGPVTVSAADIGWRGSRPPLVHILPGISAYVGGDITAGLLAHDVHRLKGKTLFLDVGTNGEIAFADGERIYACATAAGPAFEGARIRQGMRAVPGAVSKVGLSADGRFEIGVVGTVRPAIGICGTGLLDAAAAMLQAGLIEETGRIPEADEARAAGVSPGLVSLLHEDEDGMAVWLERPAGRGSSGVSLTQRDIREFQLAKGAVAAGVKVLLRAAGVGMGDVDRVLLAGGFGSYLDPVSALKAGLLPAGIPAEKVRAVGNASLAGARLCVLSEQERAEAAALARRVEYIELSGRSDFQQAFAEEMLFDCN